MEKMTIEEVKELIEKNWKLIQHPYNGPYFMVDYSDYPPRIYIETKLKTAGSKRLAKLKAAFKAKDIAFVEEFDNKYAFFSFEWCDNVTLTFTAPPGVDVLFQNPHIPPCSRARNEARR